jgi:VWFA-related protein
VSRNGSRRGLLVPALAGILIAFLGLPGLGGRRGAPPAPGFQASKPAPQPPLQHEVAVTLKLIQVFVTDANGKPALDLAKSDFTLTDNGRPQTITDFEQHVLSLPAAGRVETARPGDEKPVPDAATRPPAKTEAPLLSRKFIFLIDCCWNVLEGVAKAKLAALEFLETKVSPEDDVGLFTLSPMSGLTLYENLTRDHAKVRSKIKKLREFVGGGRDAPAGDLTGMELMNAQIFAIHGGHAGPTQRNLFSDIAEWAKALRAIPGQKNVILFTMGYGAGAVRPGNLNHVLFEAMARALASANAPVFTVDTTPQSLPGREVWDKLPSGTLPEISLAYLAETTGGKFLGGVNYAARIAEDIHDATANYYVLGYYIPATWDGKYHEVKVEVGKPGFAVHAQRGYFNPVPFAKLTPIEKHLQLLSLVLGDETVPSRTADLPMTALPFAAPRGTGNVMLVAGVSPEVIRSEVGDKTELITLVLDQTSAIADGKRAEIDWQAFKAGAGTVFEYSVISLPPGRYDCKAVVRSLDDGRAAVGACTVEVPELPDEGPVMFPPLLLVKSGEGHYMNLASAGKGAGSSELSISKVYPFPAKDYVPLVGPLDRGVGEIGAVLRCDWRGAASGEIELECALKAEGADEEIPIEAEILNAASRDDVYVYLLRFELPELAAGRYVLTIDARNAAGEALSQTTSRLELR